jgi:parallel beta-helix repeat protein
MMKYLFNKSNFHLNNLNFLSGVIINSLKLRSAKRIYQFVLVLFIVLFTDPLSATTYYVSNSGNDSNPGTSDSLSWKTLSKVNRFFLKRGDQVLFKRGDSWQGTLIPSTSGASGIPIVYGAYGTGAKPIITGFTTVTAWTNQGGNIWESTDAVSTLTTCNMVVINGVSTPMGREPNTGYYTYQSTNGTTTITSSNLTGTPNWTGAEVAVNPNNYQTKRCPITSQSGGTLTFTQPESFTFYNTTERFIIQNDIRTLDQQNEWYYNPSTKKLSIYSTSQPTNVKVSTVQNLMMIEDDDYITVKNIKFEGSNEKAMWLSRIQNLTIDNCDFQFSGAVVLFGGQWNSSGVNVGATQSKNLTVTNCTFDQTNDHAIGIRKFFSYANISNNTFTNTGLIYGANRPLIKGINNSNDASSLTAIKAPGANSTIAYNTIIYTGYIGIIFNGSNVTVHNNYVKNFCLTNHDGGGIYTWNGNASMARDSILSGTVVKNNIIINEAIAGYDGSNTGIYLDDYSNGVEVKDNIVNNPRGNGIYLHNDSNVVVRNNTVYNSAVGILLVNNRYTALKFKDVEIKRNKIIAKTNSQLTISGDYMEKIQPYLVSDSNYITRPVDEGEHIRSMVRVPFSSRLYSLPQWQSYSGQDINSKSSPVSITSENNIQLFYNNAKQAKTFNLGGSTFKDIEGKTVSGSFTLQPFTSIILIGKNFERINQKPDISDQSFHIKSPKFLNDSVGQVFAYDADTDQILDFSIIQGNESGFFSVDSLTGIIYTANKINTLNDIKINLVVRVSDNSVNSLADSATITVNIEGTDISPPIITSFSIPSGAFSLSIPIDTFKAFDDLAVVGYLLTENPDLPEQQDPSWNSSVPRFYSFSREGPQILYAWVKDAAGNISSPATEQVIITLPDLSPVFSEYLFEETAGTAIIDSQGMNNGDIVNEVFRDEGVIGKGLSFTGSGYINLRKCYGENVQNEVSLSTWIQPSATRLGLQGIIMHGGPNTDSYGLYINSTTRSIGFITSGTTHSRVTADEVNDLWDGNWHHLAVIYNGLEKIIYLDGEIILTIEASGKIDSGFGYNLLIGAGNDEINPSLLYKGGMDEVRIYNYALHKDEIEELYHSVNRVLKKINISENVTICEGENYMGWTEQGEYIRVLLRLEPSASGADSIVTTKLNLNPTYLHTEDIAIKEGENYLGWIETGTYRQNLTSVNGCDSIIVTHLHIVQPESQNIELEKGWNIFSSYLIPSQLNFESILENLQVQNQIIEVQDENGNTYKNEGIGWINNIGEMKESEGYKIRVQSSCILEITGQTVLLPMNIQLNEGWNIISFPYKGSADAMKVVYPLIEAGILEKVQDEMGNSIEYWNNSTGWLDGVYSFNPGDGYLIQANNQGVLTIQGEYDKSGQIFSNALTLEHFKTIYEGNGFRHMNINLTGLNKLNLLVGDEIAAYDGSKCVGAVKLSEININKNTVSLKASASDEDVSNGFTEGNKIELRIWQINSNSEFHLFSEVIKGDMIYHRRGSVFAQLTKKNNIEPETVNTLEFSIHPNPAKKIVTIQFSTLPEQGTKIAVLDVSGKELIVKEVQSINETLNIGYFPSGIYLAKTQLNNEFRIKKLIKR